MLIFQDLIPAINKGMPAWWTWIVYIAILAVGVLFLVKFSDMFVEGTSSIAKKMKISPLIIGLTIVAFGTSCPELAVSASDSISCLLNGGHANVAVGNVIGSNICNLLIVLGISAAFTPIVVKKSVCKKEFPILIFVSVLCTIFALFFVTDFGGVDISNGNKEVLGITRWEGIIFVLLIIAYVVYLVVDAKKQIKLGLVDANDGGEEVSKTILPTWKAILFTVIGLVGVVVGGEGVVYSAQHIALDIGTSFGLDSNVVGLVVGLTVVAVGTSLPELVTSAVAAKKGENEIALGNVIGSNIFNILLILGLSGIINPLTVGSDVWIDLSFMMISTIMIFAFALTGKIKRSHGLILIATYVIYVTILLLRAFNVIVL